MNYMDFTEVCQPGTKITDGERTGHVIKISKDQLKALVKYSDGYTEWTYYYNLEMP